MDLISSERLVKHIPDIICDFVLHNLNHFIISGRFCWWENVLEEMRKSVNNIHAIYTLSLGGLMTKKISTFITMLRPQFP